MTLLTDTTRTKGAGAVQDTYTLLRKCMRKLLKQLGYAAAGKRRGLAPETERLLATYLEQDRKAKIDWSDPAASGPNNSRCCSRTPKLSWTWPPSRRTTPKCGRPAGCWSRSWATISRQDEHGNPQIAVGTAPDRIISITDPEMRHGHKSKVQRFNGFKVSVTTEQSSEMILDIQDIPAAGSDGHALMPTIERVEQQAGVTVEQVIGDGAYGSGENRAACAARAG